MMTPCIPGEISENGLLKEVIMTLNMRTGFLVKCHMSVIIIFVKKTH